MMYWFLKTMMLQYVISSKWVSFILVITQCSIFKCIGHVDDNINNLLYEPFYRPLADVGNVKNFTIWKIRRHEIFSFVLYLMCMGMYVITITLFAKTIQIIQTRTHTQNRQCQVGNTNTGLSTVRNMLIWLCVYKKIPISCN